VANLEIKGYEVAKRYGGVLFDLAQENKKTKDILKEVDALQQCVAQEPRSWARVASPVLPPQIQRKIIEKLAKSLKMSPLMTHFLLVLCKNRRLQNLKLILDDFVICSQVAEGLVKGVVETSLALTKAQQQDLEKNLEKHLGKQVFLTQVIKEDLIAGVVLHLGSFMIDASIGMRLNKLRHEMKG
ncbi:MAG: ATP synthase F1 subunit delta, partial [Alphaproteobacteria bacterium]|nr:ATP synthase F1 subunit delta [Alphaproteobacteria bacterium]